MFKQVAQIRSFGRVLLTGAMLMQLALPMDILAQQAGQQTPAAPSSMVDPGLPSQTVALQERPTPSLISRDERYLLVLDRFTYGPRPGDLNRLRAMGLNAWFLQQMNPQKIDDAALEARLASYPAMQMPLGKLMEMYPTNQQIRASMNNRASVPGGAAAHAIYADQQERYKEKKDKTGAPVAENITLPQSPAEILALPPEQRFKALCHLTLAQLRELRKSLPPDERDQLTVGMTPEQVEAIAAFNGPSGVVQAEDIQMKLLRDVYSERQVQEVMVDFWLNHFNVYMKKSEQAPYYIAAYERKAIRPFALGRFEDLLLATATSPAMLNYLDNSSSVGPRSEYALGTFTRNGFRAGPKGAGLNENYAREVMELHTVGVNGGYTQKDVTELAKVFTGWTVGKGFGQDVAAVAQYDPTKHEPGPKVVMGLRIKENGQKEGLEALRMLAESPQCAKFISTKLAVRFVSDTPPSAMVERMSQTFLETHGDIRQVLVAMVNSPEFFTAATYRAKLKTPQEFVISAVRAVGSEVDSTAAMEEAVSQLGMPVYGMLTPNGYSMKAEAWNSTTQLVSRMNFAMALATNRVAGLNTDPSALLGAEVATLPPEEKTEKMEAVLLHDLVSEKTQRLILQQVSIDLKQQRSELQQVSGIKNQRDPLHLGANGVVPTGAAQMDTQASLAAGLILGSPEFQRR